MKKAKYTDKGLVVDILSKSFESNQSVNYITKQDIKKRERVAALMDYSFEVCNMFGNVYLTNDNTACALVLYPDQKKTTLKSILLDVKLLINCVGIGNIGKVMKRESEIKKLQAKELMYYVWFIGVDPKAQGSGVGSQLMQEIIEESEKQQRDIYLETSTLKNLPWYKKFGFDIYNELELTYKLYFLKREFSK